MTKIQVAIFALILFSCLDGFPKRMMSMYQFWQAFMTKLVPKCATYSNIRDSSSKLRNFMGQCLNVIGDKGIKEVLLNSGNSANECLAFYYEQNYLSNNSKRLVLEMKSDFEKRNNRKIKQRIVANPAGVLKEKKDQSKKNNDTNSGLSKSISSNKSPELESTVIDDSIASNLQKRMSPAKDVNKRLKGAKRVQEKS
jgi:hypothetical protein